MKKVTMPEVTYLKEHARLIDVLKRGNKTQLMKEAKKQKKELMDYLKK